eukprot:m.85672 g.85672  ORF g.85672 m.85672 type:complete len:1058 (-) comp12197_c0_seq1:1801-4974(-)
MEGDESTTIVVQKEGQAHDVSDKNKPRFCDMKDHNLNTQSQPEQPDGYDPAAEQETPSDTFNLERVLGGSSRTSMSPLDSLRAHELAQFILDQLTEALHLFILYTMVHSSEWKRLGGPGNVISFMLSNAVVCDANGRVVKELRGRKQSIRIDTSNATALATSITKYYTNFSSLDIKSLLNHIYTLNNRGTQSRYYERGVSNAAEKVRQIYRYFLHGNAHIRTISTITSSNDNQQKGNDGGTCSNRGNDENAFYSTMKEDKYDEIYTEKKRVAVRFMREVVSLIHHLQIDNTPKSRSSHMDVLNWGGITGSTSRLLLNQAKFIFSKVENLCTAYIAEYTNTVTTISSTTPKPQEKVTFETVLGRITESSQAAIFSALYLGAYKVDTAKQTKEPMKENLRRFYEYIQKWNGVALQPAQLFPEDNSFIASKNRQQQQQQQTTSVSSGNKNESSSVDGNEDDIEDGDVSSDEEDDEDSCNKETERDGENDENGEQQVHGSKYKHQKRRPVTRDEFENCEDVMVFEEVPGGKRCLYNLFCEQRAMSHQRQLQKQHYSQRTELDAITSQFEKMNSQFTNTMHGNKNTHVVYSPSMFNQHFMYPQHHHHQQQQQVFRGQTHVPRQSLCCFLMESGYFADVRFVARLLKEFKPGGTPVFDVENLMVMRDRTAHQMHLHNTTHTVTPSLLFEFLDNQIELVTAIATYLGIFEDMRLTTEWWALRELKYVYLPSFVEIASLNTMFAAKHDMNVVGGSQTKSYSNHFFATNAANSNSTSNSTISSTTSSQESSPSSSTQSSPCTSRVGTPSSFHQRRQSQHEAGAYVSVHRTIADVLTLIDDVANSHSPVVISSQEDEDDVLSTASIASDVEIDDDAEGEEEEKKDLFDVDGLSGRRKRSLPGIGRKMRKRISLSDLRAEVSTSTHTSHSNHIDHNNRTYNRIDHHYSPQRRLPGISHKHNHSHNHNHHNLNYRRQQKHIPHLQFGVLAVPHGQFMPQQQQGHNNLSGNGLYQHTVNIAPSLHWQQQQQLHHHNQQQQFNHHQFNHHQQQPQHHQPRFGHSTSMNVRF